MPHDDSQRTEFSASRFSSNDFADAVAEVDFGPENEAAVSGGDDALTDLQQPFVGRWNTLISTTNWEKGAIIHQWRETLSDAGAPATQYSDEAWSARVGGVTAPHVGRLRRVYARFGDRHTDYDGLYWSHFLAALDWDDAALWLQGAVEESWSVARMREQRWEANGGRDEDRPLDGQVVEVDLAEESLHLGTTPALGGRTARDYDGDSEGVGSGPRHESPDFGEEELSALPDPRPNLGTHSDEDDERSSASPVQPFAGLPAIPDDLSDVVEAFKLAILRHKASGYRDCPPDVIRRYLEAIATLIQP